MHITRKVVQIATISGKYYLVNYCKYINVFSIDSEIQEAVSIDIEIAIYDHFP